MQPGVQAAVSMPRFRHKHLGLLNVTHLCKAEKMVGSYNSSKWMRA